MKSDRTHPRHERTFVIIKPDGVQRALIGEVIGRFERVGLKVAAMKMMMATPELIEKHYTLDPAWRRVTGEKTIKNYLSKGLTPPSNDPLEITAKILKNLVTYMTAGPIVAFVLEGAHAVQIVRKLVGSTEPLSSDVGTIRGDYVLDSYQMSDTDARAVRNVVHASGSVKEANDEINHWFKPNELMKYKTINEKMLYDVDLDGILG
jgi:nucleoside-diphosphate kinase